MGENDNAVEQAPASPVPTITNPATTRTERLLVGIAEISRYDGNRYDKDFVLAFVEEVHGRAAILLSHRQMARLAASIGMSIDTEDQFKNFKMLLGNDEAEVTLQVQFHNAGSTYTDKNGIEVVRTESDVSLLPQTIVLPRETRVMIIKEAVKGLTTTWTSASRFTAKKATSGVASEEE